LRALIDLPQHLHAEEIELRLIKPTTLVRRVFAMIKLASVFQLTSPADAAPVQRLIDK